MDSVIVLGFGGPNGPSEVLPFLRRVTAGRGVPDERLLAVAPHYEAVGGVSPILRQHRELTEALTGALDGGALDGGALDGLTVVGANRHSPPELTDAFAALAAAGCRRAVVVLTSAYSSYSGCRSYKEALSAAAQQVPDAPTWEVLRKYHLDEGFLAPFVDGTAAALASAPEARLIFTAHSIPTAMAARCRYEAQLRESSALVAARVGRDGDWDLAWQSRSGPPSVPWLEPDVGDHVTALAATGVRDVVVVPIGFVSDHLEVVWDLDHDLAGTCASLGVGLTRVATPGTDPRFVAALAGIVRDRVAHPDVVGDGCPDLPDCCPAPARPGR